MRAILLLFLLLLVPGCRTEEDPNQVIIWHGLEGKERETLQEICQKFPVKVTLLAVPFTQLQNKFMVATPAGQGPDLVLGPQDWLGIFTTAKLLDPVPAPIADKLKGDVAQPALDGVTRDGQLYALPLVLDCLAFFRNTELAPQAPQTTEELLKEALRLQKGDIRGFYYDVQDLYFSWPFFSAYGAEVFKAGTLEPGFTGPEGAQALEFLKQLRSTGLVPLGAKNDFAKSMFLERKLAMTLNGPWFRADVKRAGVPYSIDPIPQATHKAAPFLGILGVMLNAEARHKEKAIELMDFLGQPENVVMLSLSSGRPPARKSALELAAKDPENGKDIEAFAKVAATGVPMPNHPAANAIWEPMKQTLQLVTNSQAEPSQQLQLARTTIENKIRWMME